MSLLLPQPLTLFGYKSPWTIEHNLQVYPIYIDVDLILMFWLFVTLSFFHFLCLHILLQIMLNQFIIAIPYCLFFFGIKYEMASRLINSLTDEGGLWKWGYYSGKPVILWVKWTLRQLHRTK